jgi:hypothetical protein
MAQRFEVGAITGHKFHLLAEDMNLGAAEGLLSTDFLHDYDVDLNFPAHEIRLFRQFGSCDRPKILLQGNLYAWWCWMTASTMIPTSCWAPISSAACICGSAMQYPPVPSIPIPQHPL